MNCSEWSLNVDAMGCHVDAKLVIKGKTSKFEKFE